MKNYFLFFLLFAFTSVACSKRVKIAIKEPSSEQEIEKKSEIPTKPAAEPAPKMTFEQRLINLGKIKKGVQVPISFVFTNTGDADLEIDLVSVCECTTVVERPYLPIKPGGIGKIEVVFDSSKKEESDILDIDIWLKNMDLVLDMPVLERVQYQYEFE